MRVILLCFDHGQMAIVRVSQFMVNGSCLLRGGLACRVPLIGRSWDPGSEEVETQGGNGRKWESERGRERERERESVLKSVAFVCKMI